MDMDATTQPRLRRKESREVRRRQLIDAAMETIAENGLSGTTMADVTNRAGLSIGIVNLHFDNKEGLLTETLRFLATEMRDAWADAYTDDALNPTEKLSAIIEAIFHPSICNPTKIAVWFAFFGEAQYRHTYRAMVDEFDTERDEAIEALCHKVKEDGDYDDIDPVSVAMSIESLADGLWLSILLYPDWLSPQQAKQRIYDMLHAHFPQHFARSTSTETATCSLKGGGT